MLLTLEIISSVTVGHQAWTQTVETSKEKTVKRGRAKIATHEHGERQARATESASLNRDQTPNSPRIINIKTSLTSRLKWVS